jgi:hypothetical protein
VKENRTSQTFFIKKDSVLAVPSYNWRERPTAKKAKQGVYLPVDF